jgi:glc operon protein GlcG
MLAASQTAAAKMGVALTCAVVDVRGDLVALARMDGVAFLTADVARGKAITSALFGQPSGGLPPQMGPILQSLGSIARTDILPIQGALPIVRNGQTLGAIGCSGASSQQDEDAARAGVQTFR